MYKRIIFHCDCNSFYASVELLDYPELRDVPVAVSGSEDNRHGIILAKNEAAKRFGVQTAETAWMAKRKCPQLKFLPPHHIKYRKYSNSINAIYEGYTDRVEPFGIDESWLDMTGSWPLFGSSPKQVADRLREEVLRETGLSISVGVSFNKVFAKLGSDYKKPNATTMIMGDDYRKILWPLPATAMLYVGEKAALTLKEVGIHTIGELAAADEALLFQILGKQGRQMHRYACGLDDAPVAKVGEEEPIKSVGNGLTFRRNLQGYQDVRTGVGALADEVATRLRRKKLYATTVQVMIKDTELKSITRQKPLSFATNLAKDLTQAAVAIISEHWDLAKPIRMLTITAQNLTDMTFATQTSLFGPAPGINKKRQRLEQSMDAIREKYGKMAVIEASVLGNDIGLEGEAKPERKNDEKIEINRGDK